MIEGIVNAALEAVVSLKVKGPLGKAREIEAVIDTGYDGFLTLPAWLAAELGLDFVGKGMAFLADGAEANFDVYDGVVDWDDREQAIMADAMGSTPLVGMKMLEGHRLTVDVLEGGAVVVD